MIDYNDVLQFFPPIVQETINGKAFAEIIKYFFYGNSSLKTLLGLSNATPVFDSIKKVYTYIEIDENEINEATADELAKQFRLKGYEFAGLYNAIGSITVLQIKRNFIKNALRLKRSEGTPYAVQLILEMFGYENIVITENIDLPTICDGTYLMNGKIDMSGNLSNNLFSVQIESLHDISQIDLSEQNAIISMINLYKKYRPELYQLIIIEPSNPGGRVVGVWS